MNFVAAMRLKHGGKYIEKGGSCDDMPQEVLDDGISNGTILSYANAAAAGVVALMPGELPVGAGEFVTRCKLKVAGAWVPAGTPVASLGFSDAQLLGALRDGHVGPGAEKPKAPPTPVIPLQSPDVSALLGATEPPNEPEPGPDAASDDAPPRAKKHRADK